MSRGPTLAVVALAVVTTIGAVAFHAYSGPSRGDGYVRPAPPAPVGVFRDGGTPRRDAAIERALATEFPALLELLLAGGSTEAQRAERFAYVREHPAFAAHGPALTGAWRAMIDALDTWWRVSTTARAASAANELRARIDVVSDQLASLELGYYLAAELTQDHPRRRPGIFTYRIEDVAFVRTNEERVRVLGARRLDARDAGAAVLGLTSDEELDDPIVVIDAVEAKVQGQILPVLAGHEFPIGWHAGRLPVGRVAREAIRRELLAALYNDVSSPERAAKACTKLIMASVRRHEAQHKLDQERGLSHPAVLAMHLDDSTSSPFAVRARYELSAYLSQIASDVWLPQLTLWNLARHGFRRPAIHNAESVVAVVVGEAIAHELGIRPRGPVLRGAQIDRDRLAELMIEIGGRSTVELRNAAAAAWKQLFGTQLARVYD